MTDEHEHAMKVWREAKRAHDNCPFGDSDAPDELAAAVIAADRAGLVARIAELESEVEVLADNGCHLDALCKQQDAEIERLREALLKCAEPSRYHAPCPSCGPKIVEQGCYIARAALGASNDADA